MATTGAFNATNFRMTLILDAESAEFISREREVKISIEGDKINITSKDSEGWEENLPGLKRWSGSGTAFFEFAPGSGKKNAIDFVDTFLTGDRMGTATFGTEEAGDVTINGTIILDSLEITAVMESAVEVAFAFTGSGKPTKTTNA